MRRIVFVALWCAVSCILSWGEMRTIPAGQTSGEGALDPSSPVWKTAIPVSLGLQRTPLLYPTDQPSVLEISSVQVQLLRGSGNMFVRLEWQDKSRSAAVLPHAQRAWQGEHLVKQSEATNRFSDACAVMIPATADTSGVSPSLQMGDATHTVQIYFWDATRGAAVLEAQGRETTKRTGKSFPSRSLWAMANGW